MTPNRNNKPNLLRSQGGKLNNTPVKGLHDWLPRLKNPEASVETDMYRIMRRISTWKKVFEPQDVRQHVHTVLCLHGC